MHKVNIANYVVFDIANRFNLDENRDMDAELVEMVANAWHKKHFVSGTYFSKMTFTFYVKKVRRSF